MDYNNNNYLPSKQFLKRGAFAVGLLALILTVQTDWFRALFNKKPLEEKVVSDTTVAELVGKDSNGNGIADWEEKLWGLDPTVLFTNGVSNKQIIDEKKKALGVDDTESSSDNETDVLAKQLFSITTALGDSDQTDPDTLRAIGSELGDGINLKQVNNRYSLKDIKTTKTSSQTLQTYFNTMTTLTATYKAETDVVDILVTSLESGDTSRLPELTKASTTYRSFSTQLQKVVVPVGVSDYHLALMNGFYGMNEGFSYLTQMEENGVYAVVGIAIYKQYAATVDQALIDMGDYFTQYGILH